MNKKVAMIGAGAWGTAVSTLLADNGFEVNLWCYEKSVADDIKATRENSLYLPGFELNEKIKPTNDIGEALKDAAWVFEAVPVKFLRSIVATAKPFVSEDQIWVLLSKGIEQETLSFPIDILDDVFGFKIKKVAMGGPNYSRDLAAKKYTATTIASDNEALAIELCKMLASPYFLPYSSSDIVGVELGGALKNLLSLTIGMINGAGFSANTSAFILTQGLEEMALFAESFGAKKETIFGLSGLGDLILSSFGKISRNQIVGEMLGQGRTLDSILEETGYIPEGINTVKSIYELVVKSGLDLPICTGTYDMIFEGKSIKDFIENIMKPSFIK